MKGRVDPIDDPRQAPSDAAPRRPAPGTSGGVDVAEIHATIRALARPRLSGTSGARAVAREVRQRFQALGYTTDELGFSFSTLPGRYGLPVAGAVLAATGAGAGLLLAVPEPVGALAVLVAGFLAAIVPLLTLSPALRRLPWGRVDTANLLFTRDAPRWILMAHRDTKSQPVPSLVRTLAVATALLGWMALIVLAGLGLAGVDLAGSRLPWVSAGALAAAGGVLAVSPSGNRSPGALDNASGLAALLAVAARAGPAVGFLVTDGEELGLAGARAVVDHLPDVEGVINVDGLDDHGPIRVAEARGARPGHGLASRLLRTALARGLPAVRRRLPPFILLDHQPLAAAGLPVLTVLKGDWRSLARVHRPSDSPERITGAGAAGVAGLLVAVLQDGPSRDRGTLRAEDRSGHSPGP